MCITHAMLWKSTTHWKGFFMSKPHEDLPVCCSLPQTFLPKKIKVVEFPSNFSLQRASHVKLYIQLNRSLVLFSFALPRDGLQIHFAL